MNDSTRATVLLPAMGAHEGDPIRIGDAMAALHETPRETHPDRYPVVRSSADRQPLPRWVWAAVYRRDIANPCQLCGDMMTGLDPVNLQVDHVIPWSAGGSDRTDNLRLVHPLCNARRSNHRHDQDHPQMPATHHCRACHVAWLEVRAEGDVPEMRVWCTNCQRIGYGHDEWII